MTKRRSMKRALFSSVMSVILCFTMLLGTTFAWFTDSASSGRNTIQAGNLDVVLEVGTLKDGAPEGSADPADYEWTEVDSNTKIFNDDALYEPGYVETAILRIRNNGSLALKYNLSTLIVSEKPGTNKAGEEFYLSKSLKSVTAPSLAYATYKRSILMGLAEGSIDAQGINASVGALNEKLATDAILLKGESDWITLAIVMPTTVGNEANHMSVKENEEADKYQPKIKLGIDLVATQYTKESDSFDDQYDVNAQYPEAEYSQIPGEAISVDTLDELKEAASKGGTYYIEKDLEIQEPLTVSENLTLYGYGETLTFDGTTSKISVANGKSFDVYGLTLDAEGTYSFDDDGKIVYDTETRRTTPLLSAGAGSTLTLGKGTVVENVVAQGSAVVYAKGTDENRAKIVLDGATIQNCAGESGTVINVDKASDVIIGAGTKITGNASYNNNNHGIIRVYNAWDTENPSTVTMNGGEISDNYYSGNGLVGLYYGKFIMNGGKIVDNSWFEDNQKHNGFYPVIYVHSNSKFEMNDGEISNNTVRFGVLNCLNSAIQPAIIINGGTVTNNTNTDNNEDAFAAAIIEETKNGVTTTYKSISVSENADVTGKVWDYYTGYYTLEEYFKKIQ